MRKLFMRIVSSVLSIHSSDTAGVCSSLYELGGMTVVHDASGCNSTYATHDEPRWYSHGSRTYISALTESDVIMGNDERFIDNVSQSASEFPECRFIAICGSPLPLMVGTDFAALGREIECRTNLPVLALNTNGISSYLAGVNQALTAFAKRFCQKGLQKSERKVNILGATPLDFSINGSHKSICAFLEENGFEINSVWSMDSSFEELCRAGEASVNLLVSSSALELARYFEEEFDIPYTAILPLGKKSGAICIDSLREAAVSKKSSAPAVTMRNCGNEGTIIGETLWSSSLALALELDSGLKCQVLNPLEEAYAFVKNGELSVPDEKSVEAAFSQSKRVFADPLYKPAVPEGVSFYALPHEAFSGRCFRKNMKDLCNKNLEKELEIC